jgi:membrane-associated phospholipid phosphatase
VARPRERRGSSGPVHLSVSLRLESSRGLCARAFLPYAAACLLVVVSLAITVALRWDPLQDVDTSIGAPAETWSYDHPLAVTILVWIEKGFGTFATVLYLVAPLTILWVKGYRRTVGWAVSVMVGASATTTMLKLLFHRHRPLWHHPVHALSSFSFPSGHATGVASGMGVAVVLILVHVRSARLRRCLIALAGALVVVVGADRVLLGVHNPSDVIAGYAVGGFWTFTMLVLFPPDVARA